MPRRMLTSLLLLLATATPLPAQGLRSQIADLFKYGDCAAPLCLAGSTNDGNTHGDHFIPAATAGNLAIISFISDAIGLNIANIPISAASAGATFAFENGLPVKTALSAGPVFAERAPTLGRGRWVVGANVTAVDFSTIRGIPMRDLEINFTHEDVGEPGLGDLSYENDHIATRTSIDLNLLVTSMFATVGLTDRLDLGVAVPIVSTTLRGRSDAQVNPFGSTALHYFGGTAENPILRATSFVEGSALGIGDVAVRLKLKLADSRRVAFALLADTRLPTGDEENLLGGGEISARGLGVFSMRLGTFTPHLNLGYLYRSGERQNGAFLVTTGFDQLVAPWATLAVDFIHERQIGDSHLEIPETVEFVAPYYRTLRPTSIPDMRDDVLNASIGMKFSLSDRLTAVGNALIPLDDGGLRADAIWTTGLEWSL